MVLENFEDNPNFALLFCGKILLSASADADLQDSVGLTPLMRSARIGNCQVVEVRSLESFLCNCGTICYSDNSLCGILLIRFTVYQTVAVFFVERCCCLVVLLLMRLITLVRQH